MPIAPGETIVGKCHILKLIGEGGMARVWLAEEITFGNRQVALNEPRRDLFPGDLVEIERRYQREVRVLCWPKIHIRSEIRRLWWVTLLGYSG